MEGWWGRVLSLMDRITLVRLVLTSLHVYMLSSAIILKSMIFKIKQFICYFLWGSAFGGREVHLLDWHVVC